MDENEVDHMKITSTVQGSTLTIAPEGRLDMITAPSLEKEFNDKLHDVSEVILDFSNVEYISSSGLRALLQGLKMLKGNGTMKIVNANDVVREVFEVTGFINYMTVE